MKKYEYPKEANDDNIKELVDRAKVIEKNSSYTLTASVVLSLALLVGFTVEIFLSLYGGKTIVLQDEIVLIFAVAGASSFFVSFFLINLVNAFIRRILNNFKSYYPSPEEFVFAQCILTATLFDRNPKTLWAGAVRNRSKNLSDEFSMFTKPDVLNFRRKFYADEFNLLGSGETQIGRMLLFSEGKRKKELLINFAMSLVNDDDPTAFSYLKELIKDIAEYGKLEILATRIENQLKKWKNVVALISAIVAIGATIVGLIIRFLG